MKRMKRIIAGVLAMSILISGVTIPRQQVSAAITGCNGNHKWGKDHTKIEYMDKGSVCLKVESVWNECLRCQKERVTSVKTQPYDHILKQNSSNCDGRTISVYSICYRNCGHVKVESYKCPGGPHTGKCGYLPV